MTQANSSVRICGADEGRGMQDLATISVFDYEISRDKDTNGLMWYQRKATILHLRKISTPTTCQKFVMKIVNKHFNFGWYILKKNIEWDHDVSEPNFQYVPKSLHSPRLLTFNSTMGTYRVSKKMQLKLVQLPCLWSCVSAPNFVLTTFMHS